MPSDTRSIGQVLALVKLEFPDISISKIRFLESEGLLSPERAQSGYRKYRSGDVERLRYILKMQRDHYLPLKVIREHLDLMDRGLTPPAAQTPAVPAVQAPPPEPARAPDEEQVADPSPAPSSGPVRLTRAELLTRSGLSEAAMIELERQHLIAPKRGTVHYGKDALTIAVAARRLAAYGMDARHLRSFKQAAEREVGLIEQTLAPLLRRSPTAKQTQAEVTQLVIYAHAALMRAASNP